MTFVILSKSGDSSLHAQIVRAAALSACTASLRPCCGRRACAMAFTALSSPIIDE
jgi:hypothetical protein